MDRRINNKNTSRGRRAPRIPRPTGYRESSRNAPIITLRQVIDLGVTSTSSSADTFASFDFRLLDLPGGAGFAQVFDQYRIDKVDFMAICLQTVNPVLATTQPAPVAFSVIDYDDALAPTSISSLREFNTCRVHPPLTTIRRSFRPMIALSAYSGTANGYASTNPTWLDIAYNDIRHYGIKLAFETAAQVDYRVTGTVTISLRMGR
jgi:hypothetical protein